MAMENIVKCAHCPLDYFRMHRTLAIDLYFGMFIFKTFDMATKSMGVKTASAANNLCFAVRSQNFADSLYFIDNLYFKLRKASEIIYHHFESYELIAIINCFAHPLPSTPKAVLALDIVDLDLLDSSYRQY